MEESTSWKGHSFTLLVFTGIVVLCSIFFVLGMLVGRGHGQRMAETAAADAMAAKVSPAPEEDTPELTFYESVEGGQPTLGDPAPPEPERDPPPPVAPKVKETSDPASAINLQIVAVREAAAAQRTLSQVKTKGFSGLILAPAPGDPDPWYRIQVGPYSNATEAELAKRRLESLGYKPIIKK